MLQTHRASAKILQWLAKVALQAGEKRSIYKTDDDENIIHPNFESTYALGPQTQRHCGDSQAAHHTACDYEICRAMKHHRSYLFHKYNEDERKWASLGDKNDFQTITSGHRPTILFQCQRSTLLLPELCTMQSPGLNHHTFSKTKNPPPRDCPQEWASDCKRNIIGPSRKVAPVLYLT